MSAESPFLNLPVELRLLIYEYAIDSGAITISSAPAAGVGSHSLCAIPGLPHQHRPVVRPYYDKTLLKPFLGTEDCTYNIFERPDNPSAEPTLPCLISTCRQISNEVRELNGKGSVDLYLSWPNGVCVLMYDRKLKQLLRQANTVQITGIFHLNWRKQARNKPVPSRSFECVARDGEGVEIQVQQLERLVTLVLGLRSHIIAEPSGPKARTLKQFHPSHHPSNEDRPYAMNVSLNSSSTLSFDSSTSTNLISDPFTAQAPVPLTQLTIRTFHPVIPASPQNQYHAIWAEETLVPTVVALSKICGGEIKLSVARGRQGTGTEVIAKPNQGRGRVVTCCWPKLEEKVPDVAGTWCVPDDWGRIAV